MPKGTLGPLLALLCVAALVQPPAWGQANVITAACEGTESNGGGLTTYQYTIQNTDPGPVTLTIFYLGTMDLNPVNYTGWVAPPGFTWTVGPWASLPPILSVMYTTQVKTPHSAMPPGQTWAAPGAVLWTGSAVMNPGQTLTFGFNNPHSSWDMEWFAEHPGGANVSGSTLAAPIAGPLGVFTRGYVHGPSTEPTSVGPTSFGRMKVLYR